MPCFNQFRTRFIHARLAVSADMTRELFLDSITTAHSTFRMSVCTQQWHTREWRWKRLPAPPPPPPLAIPITCSGFIFSAKETNPWTARTSPMVKELSRSACSSNSAGRGSFAM